MAANTHRAEQALANLSKQFDNYQPPQIQIDIAKIEKAAQYIANSDLTQQSQEQQSNKYSPKR